MNRCGRRKRDGCGRASRAGLASEGSKEESEARPEILDLLLDPSYANATDVERIIAAYVRGRQAAQRELPAPVVPEVDEAEEFRRLFDFFCRLVPPKFDGTDSYVVAENWLENIKAKFDFCRAPEYNHVELATYFLEGGAKFWWERVKREYQGDPLKVPWKWFEEQFTRRYLSTFQKEILRRQFATLRQEDLSVAKYNDLFVTLSRYAPDIRGNPCSYCRHYLKGLNSNIAMYVDKPMVKDVQTLMDHATRVEYHIKRMEEEEKEEEEHNVRPKLGQTSRGECYYNSKACFQCGQEDHWKRDCPQLLAMTTRGGGTGGVSGSNGRGQGGIASHRRLTGGRIAVNAYIVDDSYAVS